MNAEQVRTAVGEPIPVWRCGECGGHHADKDNTHARGFPDFVARAAERCCRCIGCGRPNGRAMRCDDCRRQWDERVAVAQAEEAARPAPPPWRVSWPGHPLDGLAVGDHGGDSLGDDLRSELEARGMTLTQEPT